MFNLISDWVTLIAGVLVVIAGFATIFGVWIVFKTWKTWKKHQTFIYEMDLLLEAEVAISDIYANAFHRFSRIYTIQKNVLSSTGTSTDNQLLHKLTEKNQEQLDLYEKYENDFFELNRKYQTVKQKLEFMGIDYIDEFDPYEHEMFVQKIKDEVLIYDDLVSLENYAKGAMYKIGERKKECLQKMKQFREDLCS
ncbi:hypothetical protein [Acinetobacter equi]|uniref:Uncharacterized protein n=1 Tax=Acinetobacter equi TaxID=1324350 RepID=A0A0N7GXX1_9GAMM|nr:hypothetical protein [Acinetobacter equi]ALH95899.1 hypothetical protein AOY20_10355 [Acinetobacter equi]